MSDFPGPLHLRPEDGEWPTFADVSFADVTAVPDDVIRALDDEITAVGGPFEPDPERAGASGYTMFDSPASEDNSVTVLLADGQIAAMPSQSLVRIKSKDSRSYLGTVVAGPFAEPDGLRADSTILVTTVTRGGVFVPPYHGRVQVEILGEERDGALVPPQFRPLPNSAVFVLDDAEAADILGAEGEIRLGRLVGRPGVTVAIPVDRKDVLPRHMAVLGTTGGGKTTTVAGFIRQARAADCAVILLDVEGEYTFLNEPTSEPKMLKVLEGCGLSPEGIPNMTLYHLSGRETANPDHPARQSFSLQFGRLSPYAIMDILELSEAQQGRFMQAYEVAKQLLRKVGIFPAAGNREQERIATEIDELERGWPRMTLSLFLDVVSAGLHVAQKLEEDQFQPFNAAVAPEAKWLLGRFKGDQRADHAASWRALRTRLWGLHRLKAFDQHVGQSGERGRMVGGGRQEGDPLRYDDLRAAGTVNVIDLSDVPSPALNNLVIADLLGGVLEAQDEAFARYEKARRAGEDVSVPPRVLIVIEEAHEFLSAERIAKMPVLFGQVARIARRGRKRWLGLVFVTQLPQHLPRELFGLVNSYVLHKIADPQVVDVLRRTVSGIDASLWKRLPGLAPGQAIVAFPHLKRPLLVAMDPAPSQLRLVD